MQKEEEEVSSSPLMSPWSIFLYGMKAPVTREKYIGRLPNFLISLGYKARWKNAPRPSQKGARDNQTGYF